MGDANLDGKFDSGDLSSIFATGKYRQDVFAEWFEGDWTGDNRFNALDLVEAFKDGGYSSGKATKRAASARTERMHCLAGRCHMAGSSKTVSAVREIGRMLDYSVTKDGSRSRKQLDIRAPAKTAQIDVGDSDMPARWAALEIGIASPFTYREVECPILPSYHRPCRPRHTKPTNACRDVRIHITCRLEETHAVDHSWD